MTTVEANPEQESESLGRDDENIIGYINFDGTAGENNEVEIRVPAHRLSTLRRDQYVMLESNTSGRPVLYLARIVSGPFYVPDAVNKDSAFARASILQADTVRFRPDFHGVCTAEILGQIVDEKSLALIGTSTRPFPQATVRKLSGQQIERLLGLGGDIYLGELSGYEGVKVKLQNDDKRVLPRNVGVFGTVGSGKTNTSQTLIEEVSRAGWAVVVLDVEGEYVEMDKPSIEASEKPSIKKLMERFGVEPDGIKNLEVFHCINTEPSREEGSKEFCLRFSNMSPYVLAEILDFSGPQMDRFLEAWFHLKEKKSKAKKKPKSTGLAGFLMEEDEDLVPGMTLQDLVEYVHHEMQSSTGSAKSSWATLLRKLNKLDRYKIFDQNNDLGDYSELFQPQQVSVFDMSSSHNVWINNIVISDILRGLFKAKLNDKENRLPPVMVVIEEAHTFVSKQNVGKMEATLDVLRDISRRGRKRWISLCFITQQPSHLPPEIYELCNTKIVHQTTGSKNLEALKNSAGGVHSAVWGAVPIMGQGRCMVISPAYRHTLMCDVRPCSSNRKFTQ